MACKKKYVHARTTMINLSHIVKIIFEVNVRPVIQEVYNTKNQTKNTKRR